MAGQFNVTHEEMVAFSGRISQVNESIQGEIQRLQTVVDSITSGWKGQAATAYNNLQNQVNEDATALNRVLNEIKEAIDATAQNYQTSEDEQASSISHVASGAEASPFG
ncbi:MULTISPECIES: WXG100 family type VII secretion target [unclassified Streptomyces]|jgi:WXG100 family type VII secretion target|uniref:WXG100 family type VII secretion target n=1 Tax=unclassified Streptomyces TaxID=2593676 RepID=UPI0033BA4B75